MNKLNLLLLFCLSPALLYCQNGKSGFDPGRKYNVEDLQKDLRILKTTIEETHPGLYTYSSPHDLQSRFDSLLKSIQGPETELQFYSSISSLVAGIGCGHTNVLLSKEYKNVYEEKEGRYLPLRVKILKDKIYVLENLSTDTNLVAGSELLEMNGRSSSQIINRILPHISSDGYNQTLKYRDLEEEFIFHYAHFIEQPGWYTLSLKRPADELIQHLVIPALHLDELRRIGEKRKKPGTLLGDKEKLLQLQLTEDKIAILTIRSLDGEDIAHGGQRFRHFLKASFDTLQNRGVNDLIIDMRNNGGGDDDHGWYLYSFLTDTAFQYYERVEMAPSKKYTLLKYTNRSCFLNLFHVWMKRDASGRCLWTHGPYTHVHKPNSLNFRGQVYMLINGGCFSATAEVAAVADSHKRAVFIGEETGGAYQGNNSGLELTLTLPNTHLRVKIPMMKYVCAVDPNHLPGRGIIPQFAVDPTIQDLVEGIDTEKEFALDLIRKKNCKACGR
jgi:hypothetical protein